MPEYLLIVLALVVIYLLSAGRRLGYLSPSSLFLYTQTIMAVGTLPHLSAATPADRTHGALIVMTHATVVVVSIFVSMLTPTRRATYAPQVNYDYPRGPVWCWVIISMGIGALYYVSIGYIAFFESLDSVVNGSDADLAGLRLGTYAGQRYLFPGYVNQFKNALLPALVLVILVAAFHYLRARRWVLLLALAPATAVLLLGTGQRSPIVRILVFALVLFYLVAPARVGRYIPRIAAVGIPAFFLATYATGRAREALAQADGFFGVVQVFVEQTISRIFGSSQLASTVGFRYIYGHSIPVGSDWWDSLVGLLPGQSGSHIANDVFALLYGSTRGTAPLSIWGSAYFNFGFGGAILFAALIGAIFAGVSVKINRIRTTNIIQLTGVAGVTMSIGLWISESPVSPLNGGLLVYMLLWWWGGRVGAQSAVLAANTGAARHARSRAAAALR